MRGGGVGFGLGAGLVLFCLGPDLLGPGAGRVHDPAGLQLGFGLELLGGLAAAGQGLLGGSQVAVGDRAGALHGLLGRRDLLVGELAHPLGLRGRGLEDRLRLGLRLQGGGVRVVDLLPGLVHQRLGFGAGGGEQLVGLGARGGHQRLGVLRRGGGRGGLLGGGHGGGGLGGLGGLLDGSGGLLRRGLRGGPAGRASGGHSGKSFLAVRFHPSADRGPDGRRRKERGSVPGQPLWGGSSGRRETVAACWVSQATAAGVMSAAIAVLSGAVSMSRIASTAGSGRM